MFFLDKTHPNLIVGIDALDRLQQCNLTPNSTLHVRLFNKLCKMKLFIQT